MIRVPIPPGVARPSKAKMAAEAEEQAATQDTVAPHDGPAEDCDDEAVGDEGGEREKRSRQAICGLDGCTKPAYHSGMCIAVVDLPERTRSRR